MNSLDLFSHIAIFAPECKKNICAVVCPLAMRQKRFYFGLLIILIIVNTLLRSKHNENDVIVYHKVQKNWFNDILDCARLRQEILTTPLY